MNNILFLKSSLNGQKSHSNMLAQELVSQLASKSKARVVERDLATQSLAHLSQSEMTAWMIPAKERSDEQLKLADVSDTLIKELQTTETVVIGMPMYNFAVPSTFKAWADRIARAGITFRYTENGPIGLLENKKNHYHCDTWRNLCRHNKRFANSIPKRFFRIYRHFRYHLYLCRGTKYA
jgi:FMN-dependent NADH-azoreductase